MKRNGASGELAQVANLLSGRFSTVILQVNYPIHKGQPNPKHGMFFFAGSIPAACYDQVEHHSLYYATEQDAIDAALAAGAERLQGVDCRRIK
jgi:hypothetical protein